MKKSTRNKIKDILHGFMRDSMFGDGLEDDYIRDGVTIIGLDHMEDKDLISELEELVNDDEDDEFFELLQQAKDEMKK